VTREETHFNKVNAEIKTAFHRASSKGQLGGGALSVQLCQILLYCLKEYSESEYLYTLNEIKSDKDNTNIDHKKSCKEVNDRVSPSLSKYESILKNAVVKTQGFGEDRGNTILRELDFLNKAGSVLKGTLNKYEATYSEYLDNIKKKEETLKLAKQANCIAKGAALFTGAISVAALIVSIASYYK
tara:strand:- start:342 stop:896 length:555 start_codon:yes stop_codon:yes gene_type:complete